MRKIDTIIFKIKENIVFPYQKVNINFGEYTDQSNNFM